MKFQSMLSMSIMSLFLICLLSPTASLEAHPMVKEKPRFEKLGVRTINYKLDRDEIPVTIRDGRFTAITLKVKKAPVNLRHCVIHYANGKSQKVEFRKNIPAGGQTRLVNLEGGKRVIRKVVFWYDTQNFAGRKGQIELWGRH